MNKLTLGIGGGLLLGTLVAFTLMKSLQNRTPQYGIILRATTADIDSTKWGTIMTKVLNAQSFDANASPRDQLYRIRDFVDGSPAPGSQDLGTMDESLLLEDRRVPDHFTGHAFQIGIGGKESSQKIPNLQMPQAHLRPNMTESNRMVGQVNDILSGP